jgi:CheY-like chemotaxis protein
MSRIVTGKLRLDVRPVDPVLPIEAAIDSVLPAADAKRVRIQKAIEGGVAIVSGDADRLQQIVWNLLSNAVKFTPAEGLVQIRLERQNSHIEIHVTDSGIGIKPEFLPFVFDRFRQADATATRAYGGLGLGLAIVRHLVELHSGEVSAHSEGQGRGATFSVKLPPIAAYEPVASEERMNSRVDESLPQIDALGRLDGLRALVVDDEQDTCELLKTMLENSGAEVTIAKSAEEGLTALAHSQFHVILSDIGMPETDGYRFMLQVRQLPTDRGGRIPAVALTAYARTEDRLKALRAGYQMHVPKPIEYAELVTVMASLGGRQ